MTSLDQIIQDAEARSLQNEPQYHLRLKAIQQTLNAPKEYIPRFFRLGVPGKLGMNRLEETLYQAFHIPTRVDECKCSPLDADKTAIVLWAVRSSLRTIVTVSEYEAYVDMYHARLEITEDHRFAALLGPRQIGKTTTMADIILAICLACPGIKVPFLHTHKMRPFYE